MKKIRLVFDHTNETGKKYAGQEVELPDEEAEWVVRVTGAVRLTNELVALTPKKANNDENTESVRG